MAVKPTYYDNFTKHPLEKPFFLPDFRISFPSDIRPATSFGQKVVKNWLQEMFPVINQFNII